MMSNDGHDTWFVSFRFPYVMGREKMEHKIKEWIRRLIQSLEAEESEIFTSFLISNTSPHAHLVVKVPGLGKLDQKKWEEKWIEVTGKKVKEEVTSLSTVRQAGVIRRRQGEESVISYIRKPVTEVIDEVVRWTHGGSCSVRQVRQSYLSRNHREYVCTKTGISHYLQARHSQEILRDPQFVGFNA